MPPGVCTCIGRPPCIPSGTCTTCTCMTGCTAGCAMAIPGCMPGCAITAGCPTPP
eukprot:CAMPEP_0119067306 /NCGR_PEP_ID=MMETSP1178-20130426/9659_1 /TAXON_ID=33656 /ORGANISM="unid sp, Strain CCMP2000" /LENGTH=54 /DNA_ID=CAMNT_0007048953 /DNA_START=9 /DNA_END=170 /DNA_ORIENTATION=-